MMTGYLLFDAGNDSAVKGFAFREAPSFPGMPRHVCPAAAQSNIKIIFPVLFLYRLYAYLCKVRRLEAGVIPVEI